MNPLSLRNPELQRHRLLAWVLGNQLSTPKGDPVEFASSPWLGDIYNDSHGRIAVVKSSQARISTWAIYRTLWFAIHNRATVIFTQPTATDAMEFSSSRVWPLVRINDWLLDYVDGGAQMLRIAQQAGGTRVSHVHFKGTFGEKESLTVDADLLIIDELDFSDSEVVASYDTRLIASKWKHKLQISTPSIPMYGVDMAYQMSDQRVWLWTCQACNTEVNPREEYYQIIDREKCVFRCPHCGKELDRWRGRWVERYPGRNVHGYAITQPICLYVPVSDIVHNEMTQKPRTFKNYWLGLPSDEGVAAITRDTILQKCFLSGHGPSTTHTGGGRVMGVDQGDRMYYEVREVDPSGRSNVVELGTTRSWGDLYAIMRRQEIEVCVVDARPEFRLARQTARDFKGRVWFCEFAQIPVAVKWRVKGKPMGYIQANRTDCIDASADDIQAGLIQLYEPRDDEIDQECMGGQPGGWIQHWVNMHRVEPEDSDGKVVWKETGPDHRAFASIYAKIAESRLRKRSVTEMWVPTAGQRMFAPQGKARPVVAEEEVQEKTPVMHRPIVDLRKGMGRR